MLHSAALAYRVLWKNKAKTDGPKQTNMGDAAYDITCV